MLTASFRFDPASKLFRTSEIRDDAALQKNVAQQQMLGMIGIEAM